MSTRQGGAAKIGTSSRGVENIFLNMLCNSFSIPALETCNNFKLVVKKRIVGHNGRAEGVARDVARGAADVRVSNRTGENPSSSVSSSTCSPTRPAAARNNWRIQ